MNAQASTTSLKVDPKEFELPETVFIRDIETKVFQSIILQCLSEIKGISLTDGGFIDSLLGREGSPGIKGIYVEQDQQKHAVSVKVEVNICYGIAIPEKAEEIQTTVAHEMTRLTGLHVACVHVVFKNLVSTPQCQSSAIQSRIDGLGDEEKEYTDEF